MEITTPDADAGDIATLISEIQNHTQRRIENRPIQRKSDFIQAAQAYPDLVCEFLVLLRKQDPQRHQYLWLFILTRLASATTSFYDQNENIKSDQLIKAALTAIHPSVQIVWDCLVRFMKVVDLNRLLNVENSALRRRIRKEFLNLLDNALEFVATGPEVMLGTDALSLISRLLESYFSIVVLKDTSRSFEAESFETIVAFLKAAFFCGQPETILPLVCPDSGQPVLTELYACEVMAQHSISFSHVMDYYRYAGYCLVTAATLGPSINEKYADLADIFLKVLLNMPNVNVSNYQASVDQSDALTRVISRKHHITPKEREELSFYFGLNYLLRMRDLSTLLHPDTYYRQEIRFFLNAFINRASSELDQLATQSYSNSVVNMQRLEQQAVAVTTQYSRTLSSILYDGTYKEKVQLVINFFELQLSRYSVVDFVQKFNFSEVEQDAPFDVSFRHSDLHHLVERIDPQFSGKLLYVQAINKVVRLCELLTITHLHSSAGLCTDADAVLARLFHTTYTFAEVAEVKNLMAIENGKLVRKYYEVGSDEDRIKHQFAMLETTQDIDAFVLRMI